MTMKPSLYRLLNAATLIAAALLPSPSIAWSSSLLSINSRRGANNANRLSSPCSYYSSNAAYLSPVKSSFNSLMCSNRQREAAAVAPLKLSQVDITNSSDEESAKIANEQGRNNKKNLVIGPRIGSGTYGTVHIALLNNNNDDKNDDDNGSRSSKEKTYYIAKRAWTLAELELNVPSAVMELDDNNELNSGVSRVGTGLSTASSATGLVKHDASSDSSSNDSEKQQDSLQEKAERCRYYWNVERHIFEKLQRQQQEEEGGDGSRATPQFIGMFRSNNESEEGGEEEIVVPGYGKLDGPNNSDSNDNNDRNDILGGFLSAITINNSNSDDDNKEEGHEWMLFEYIPSSIDDSSQPLTLLDAMEMDLKNQEVQQQRIQLDYQNHSLDYISKALNLDANTNDDIFGNTLDVIFVSLLEDLKIVHECNIVHRDVKPGNLLCDGANNRLRLIDFGSGADLDPSSPPSAKQQQSSNGLGNIFSNSADGQQQEEEQQKRRVGFNEGIAALSPIYSAPETFIKLDANPLSFDVFSAAVMMCQLLFNTLDERSNTELAQQLREVDYDLDAWLKNSLGNDAMIGSSRFDEALEYLGERRGLWGLLKNMLQPNPMNRISSAMVLESLREVLALKTGEIEWSDEAIARVAREESYLETVIDSFDKCTISYGDGQDDNRPRPLHFLASFTAGMPVGLVLSEASGDDIDDNSDTSEEAKRKWKEATKFAFPGEVFVKGWSTNGQADKLGVFEVGDRLRGVGELPFTNAGFEAAVDLIERQPMTRGVLKLHFDRLSASRDQVQSSQNVDSATGKKVTSQGVWKTKGRRGDQEDSFVLHEIKNDATDGILLAGVFDGHAGTAASESVSNILPFFFGDKLSSSTSGEEAGSTIRDAVEASWRTTCNTYRNGCDENGEVVVDYDHIEGVIFEETRSASPVEAGCTATVAAISMNPNGANELTILNCGDSKTILIGEPIVDGGSDSVVVFETRDHSPDDKIEIERLSRGKELGLDYSIPEDSPYGSYMRVGDFQYALCRSLEGSYVTSKGIVSDPDITRVNLVSALAGRQHNAIVLACDGLLEVMSSEEIGREVVLMRKAGYKAGEVAKNLCGQALKRGSYDNISVVVVHLDW